MPETFFTTVYPSGHGIFFAMPSTEPNDSLINFAIYTHTPPGLQRLLQVTLADQITPEQREWFQQVALNQMPPRFADMVLVCLKDNISIHPILDRVPESFVTLKGHGLLLGDAGAVLRPHTASGTTKAIAEALLLEKLVSEPGSSWQDVSSTYELDRMQDAIAKVTLGERLGRAQVLETPAWNTMGPVEFEEWLTAQVSDSRNYMYKNLEKAN